MLDRKFFRCALSSIIVVCVFLIGPAIAQIGFGPATRNSSYPGTSYLDNYPAATYPGGKGLGWSYYNLPTGPYVNFPGVRGGYGGFWSNGISLCGPPISTYGPTPEMFTETAKKVWRYPWWPNFGWIGPWAASPRPKPTSVNVWSRGDLPGTFSNTGAFSTLPAITVPPLRGNSIVLAVKVPQSATELLVDGLPTKQTGTDRTYESPPLDDGKAYRYDLTARWTESGTIVERKMTATGRAGEVVRVDFTGPERAQASK